MVTVLQDITISGADLAAITGDKNFQVFQSQKHLLQDFHMTQHSVYCGYYHFIIFLITRQAAQLHVSTILYANKVYTLQLMNNKLLT